ncbi:hypothetical protein TBLA_0H00640 [Henningerozyma blattae CBS 6284]|uniref:Septin-type G domain-containing protein n=1 Tax=Henningerozyma blattae (strain ATCC 34711 / CBS 6284 / DSM 70876 / NBRC 10599 / NRRL Y-10934 / UCD 77-7) TaxID=1071380 RepID=I2H7K3_HENB6|nr:hypothetical protein TBLA_0H00640 [Tetrapisispora blattae CBS 6284]CCH62355.1 hypothetical protein TBLA_0H00640 [Tetrapisispora blattae CBS 6284]
MTVIQNINYSNLNTGTLRLQKSAKKGARLCIMVLGDNGTGKSTFLNNLCNENIFPTVRQVNYLNTLNDLEIDEKKYEPITETIEIVEEENTKKITITLDVVLFPYAGYMVDNSMAPGLIKNYLDEQFYKFLKEEKRINRKKSLNDTRPHVCIYFLRATSRGLNEYDIKCMQEICNKVNIIPIISKADTLTEDELSLNKKLIMDDIKKNNINIFDFQDDSLEGTLIEIDKKEISITGEYIYPSTLINDLLPFAIICGNQIIKDENNNLIHIRKYPWGQVVIEDRSISEYVLFKGILLGSHLQDFKDTTINILYETYRTNKLLQEGTDGEFIENPELPLPILTKNSISGSQSLSRSASRPQSSRSRSHPRSEGNTDSYQGNATNDTETVKDLEEQNKLYQMRIEELEKKLKESAKLGI